MKISSEMRLRELQNEFNAHFPHLRIEFYGPAHKEGKPSGEAGKLDPELTVQQVRGVPLYGYMPLNGYQKVGAFEQLFARTFGLNVQVFRRSYGKWLQTWATDIWTLDEQNNRGRIMGDR